MPYQYKMVQVPTAISVSGSERGTEAASYLESLATGQASQGGTSTVWTPLASWWSRAGWPLSCVL